MFDKIFEVLTACFKALLPWVVVEPYERSCLIRLGVFKRELGPGFHWIFPFCIDTPLGDHVTPRTERLSGLSTTTKDGKAIGFDAVVTYRISNVRKALLEVTDLKDAVADTCAGVIGTNLSRRTWDDVLHGEVVEELSELCRKRGLKWGIEVMAVQLCGIALVRNIRIMSSGPAPVHHLTPAGT